MKELITIQVELHAPKNLFNKFGNYNYRSCEGILEAVKPLLEVTQCFLTLSDEIVLIGDRFYVKATATITNLAGEQVQVVGMAREEESKKGMDGSQITGSASSYARKYALNGLLAIDDTKDADDLNTSEEQPKRTRKAQVSKEVEDAINGCSTREELITLWRTNANEWGKSPACVALFKQRTAEVEGKGKEGQQ